jgi:hypothetical protein
MIDMTHRPHIRMRLVPLELLLTHDLRLPSVLLDVLVVVVVVVIETAVVRGSQIVRVTARYSPRTRATISSCTDLGVCWYESNCIV